MLTDSTRAVILDGETTPFIDVTVLSSGTADR
jgi:hypothetical protein